jgi:hypothetical protein
MPLRDPQQTAIELFESQNQFVGEGYVVGYQFAFEVGDSRRLTVRESKANITTSQIVAERELPFGVWVLEIVKKAHEDGIVTEGIESSDIIELQKRIGLAMMEGVSHG